MFFPFFYFFLSWIALYAESKYPVDVSYMVSDLKYSRKEGLKICEVQHGALSAVLGDLFLSGEDGSISPLIAEFFTQYPMKKWAAGWIYPPLQRSFAQKGWEIHPSTNALLKDPTFLVRAAAAPANRYSIASYAGLVYAAPDLIRHYDYYRRTYPGILFIDAATFPYWKDKYAMNELFETNEELKKYKADWKLYPKKYDPLLSQRIQFEMPSDHYVIKPRKECLANGVIVIAKEDLDGVLQMILEPLDSLEKHPDKKYAYWRKNREDTFLIEKYYRSDLLRIPHPLGDEISSLAEYHFDATMRIAFILQYNEGAMSYRCLGGFWKLPSKAIEEEGTLNERCISCCEPPFYYPIDAELFQEVNEQMERAMLLLYEAMLNNAMQDVGYSELRSSPKTICRRY